MAQVDFNGYTYEIDEYGNVSKRSGKGFVKCFPDKDGYLKITIRNKKTEPTYNEYIHRAVFRTFNGEIPEEMSVDHIDKDRLNNHKDNLQLMTMEDNAVKGNAENWFVMSPDGNVFEIYNLRAFCRENNLHSSHLVTHSYKGWKAIKQ
jgi:hypothetical protein